ncbi:hypothetical protein [Bizionia myxarmorum]|uniref:Uncharacterized protein n=1 Tax=Bizionia myxarmorum TaxID=291186 RepID=A0A5D0R9Y7_9FLAO|nr:hypothetical protein [Bizionia myxarmorum]TYB78322.1 hypothetical protein ES674_00650 [Bizionia myxarmorum]
MPAQKSHNPTNAKINKNFVIRIQETAKLNKSGTMLFSASKYRKLVGEEMAETHFYKALNGGLDKYTFKLRNRLKIDFHGK